MDLSSRTPEAGPLLFEAPEIRPMRQLAILWLVIGTTLIPSRVQSQTAISVGAQIGDFHVAVSNYYHVPEREVIVLRERRIHDDELPVVLFIAQRARVSPATIVDLRLRGLSWWDISVRYGMGPDVYYVPVAVAPGPPYGRAYGHYKKPRKHWNTIVLSDDDVVNLVHVRFLSDYYRVPPERVMEVRGRQRDFVAVHYEVSGRGSKGGHDDRGGDSKGQGNGKGKGKRGRR
jgi:hypothetical protein